MFMEPKIRVTRSRKPLLPNGVLHVQGIWKELDKALRIKKHMATLMNLEIYNVE